MSHSYTSSKRLKTFDSRTFSRGIEMARLAKMGSPDLLTAGFKNVLVC